MTTTHVALLRAVNVGGATIPMARLRELAVGLGWSAVSTHLGTGNVLLASPEPAATIARRLAAALEAELGRPVPVLVRTPAQLADVLERVRPVFPNAEPGRVHVAFLDRDPGSDAADGASTGTGMASVDERLGEFAPDAHAHLGHELALHYPQGLGRSKLTTAVIERRLGVVATVRGLRSIEGTLARAGVTR